MNLKTILTPAELQLYKRHIEDGMALEDLSDEIELSHELLVRYWKSIEDKLREVFKRERKADKHG